MLCCLCRNNSVKLLDINDEDVPSIRTIILKYFTFISLDNIELDDKICRECWPILQEFHHLYIRVEQAHKEFIFLDQSSFDDRDIKEESLLDDIKIEPLEVLESVLIEKQEQIKKVVPKTKSTALEASIPCNVCNKAFKSHKTLRKHTENTHSSFPESKPTYKCSQCDEIIANKTLLKAHMKLHTEDEEDEQSLENLEEREVSDRPNKNFSEYDKTIKEFIGLKCNFCNYDFDSFSDMIKHCQIDHDENGYIECCGKKYDKRWLLYDHVLQHKYPDKHLVCDICNKKFKYKRNLKVHKIAVHTSMDERPYPCDQCPKRFASVSILNTHKAFHGEGRFACPTCGTLRATKSALKYHMVVHETNASFICDVCSKAFKRMSLLKEHMITHTKEKKQCKICGTWVRNLRIHTMTHDKLQLDCKECGKLFETRTALKSHTEYHRKKRIFDCTYCDKSFKSQTNLKEHVATHTGEILYTCPHCPATFNSNANMYRHRKLCATKTEANLMMQQQQNMVLK